MAKEPDAKSFIESLMGEFSNLNKRLDGIEKRLPPEPKSGEPVPNPAPKKERSFFESLLFGEEE